ncbi:hypothetical protein DFJ73DRAFT_899353 [Zopfochytrium polystomum]|nr:hypothetical protein DFJ73DRAFT_899353 [Zopfochytrium polystomum]
MTASWGGSAEPADNIVGRRSHGGNVGSSSNSSNGRRRIFRRPSTAAAATDSSCSDSDCDSDGSGGSSGSGGGIVPLRGSGTKAFVDVVGGRCGDARVLSGSSGSCTSSSSNISGSSISSSSSSNGSGSSAGGGRSTAAAAAGGWGGGMSTASACGFQSGQKCWWLAREEDDDDDDDEDEVDEDVDDDQIDDDTASFVDSAEEDAAMITSLTPPPPPQQQQRVRQPLFSAHLPPELIRNLLAHLSTHPATLLEASLVCRSWYSLAASVLWCNLTFADSSCDSVGGGGSNADGAPGAAGGGGDVSSSSNSNSGVARFARFCLALQSAAIQRLLSARSGALQHLSPPLRFVRHLTVPVRRGLPLHGGGGGGSNGPAVRWDALLPLFKAPLQPCPLSLSSLTVPDVGSIPAAALLELCAMNANLRGLALGGDGDGAGTTAAAAAFATPGASALTDELLFEIGARCPRITSVKINGSQAVTPGGLAKFLSRLTNGVQSLEIENVVGDWSAAFPLLALVRWDRLRTLIVRSCGVKTRLLLSIIRAGGGSSLETVNLTGAIPSSSPPTPISTPSGARTSVVSSSTWSTASTAAFGTVTRPPSPDASASSASSAFDATHPLHHYHHLLHHPDCEASELSLVTVQEINAACPRLAHLCVSDSMDGRLTTKIAVACGERLRSLKLRCSSATHDPPCAAAAAAAAAAMVAAPADAVVVVAPGGRSGARPSPWDGGATATPSLPSPPTPPLPPPPPCVTTIGDADVMEVANACPNLSMFRILLQSPSAAGPRCLHSALLPAAAAAPPRPPPAAVPSSVPQIQHMTDGASRHRRRRRLPLPLLGKTHRLGGGGGGGGRLERSSRHRHDEARVPADGCSAHRPPATAARWRAAQTAPLERAVDDGDTCVQSLSPPSPQPTFTCASLVHLIAATSHSLTDFGILADSCGGEPSSSVSTSLLSTSQPAPPSSSFESPSAAAAAPQPLVLTRPFFKALLAAPHLRYLTLSGTAWNPWELVVAMHAQPGAFEALEVLMGASAGWCPTSSSSSSSLGPLARPRLPSPEHENPEQHQQQEVEEEEEEHLLPTGMSVADVAMWVASFWALRILDLRGLPPPPPPPPSTSVHSSPLLLPPAPRSPPRCLCSHPCVAAITPPSSCCPTPPPRARTASSSSGTTPAATRTARRALWQLSRRYAAGGAGSATESSSSSSSSSSSEPRPRRWWSAGDDGEDDDEGEARVELGDGVLYRMRNGRGQAVDVLLSF